MNNKTYFKNQSRMGKITTGIIGILSLFYMISCSSEIDVVPIASTVEDPQAMLSSTNGITGNPTPPSPLKNLVYLTIPFTYQDKKAFPFIYQNGLIAHQLSWDAPDSMGTIDGTTPATLAGYVVKYKTGDSDFVEIDENSEGVRLTKKIGVRNDRVWIAGLSLNTAYTFLVAASNSASMVTPDADAATRTTIPVPFPPMNFQVVSSSTNQVVLSWNHPTTNSYYTYSVNYKKAGDNHFIPFYQDTNTTTTVRGLSPFTKYTFRIWSYNSRGTSISPFVQIEHLTALEGATPPSPLKNLVYLRNPFAYQDKEGFPFIYQNGLIAHRLSWDTPNSMGTIGGTTPATLAGYVVKYKTGDSDFIEIDENSEGVRLTKNIDVRDDRIWIAGLSLNTAYTFLVAAKNSAGMVTPDADAATRTTIPIPLPPMNFQIASSTSNQVVLSWDHPITNSYYTYSVAYQKARDNHFIPFYQDTNTTVTVRGLSPFTKYTFRIISYNSRETFMSPFVKIEHTTVPEGATPPSPVRGLEVFRDPMGSYKNGFIEKNLLWNWPTNMGTVDETTPATLAGYVVKYKTGDSDFIEIDENSEGVRLTKNIDANNYNVWISGLSPNSSYTFLVAASNSVGLVTPDADAATVTTTTEPPSPMSLQVVSSTSSQVVLSWHYPSAKPDYHYYLSYKKPGDSDFTTIYPRKEGVRLSEKIGTNTTATVRGLSPATEYTFAVRAFDSQEYAKSPLVEIEHTTAPDGANPPSPVIVLDAVANTLYKKGFIEMHLSWVSPANMGTIDGTTPATLAGYVVKYKIAGDNDFIEIDENSEGVRLHERIRSGDINSVWISGLSPNSSYTFLVAASNSAGMVTPDTDAATFTTPTIPPPTNFQIVSSSTNQVVLSWFYPSTKPDYHYFVSYKKTGDRYFTTLNTEKEGVRLREKIGTNTTVTVLGLSPATEYTFAVHAYDYRGSYITSPRVLINHTTAVPETATPPSPVKNLMVAEDPFYNYQNGFIEKNLLWSLPTNMGTIDGTTPATLTGYVLKYKTGDSDFIEIDENSKGVRLLEKIGIDNTNIWISGLSPTGYYTFLLAASNSVGLVTPDADAATVTTTTGPPSAMNFRIVSSTSSQVVLSWHDLSTNPYYRFYYHISYKKAGDSFFTTLNAEKEGVRLAEKIGTNTTATVIGLSPNTEYIFAVRAFNSQGDARSPRAQIEHTTVSAAATPPSPVGNLRKILPSSNQVVLIWTAPTNTGTVDGINPATIIGYSVWYKETGDSHFSKIDENSQGVRLAKALTGTSTTTTITGLKPGLTYTFSVVAKNPYGETPYTNQDTQTSYINQDIERALSPLTPHETVPQKTKIHSKFRY